MLHAGAVTRIGPNAIIQTCAALDAHGGRRLTRDVMERAGIERYLDALPDGMVPETEVAALFRAMTACLPPNEARELARQSGRRTGEYILANRIPAKVQWLLKRLPRALAGPILLSAISRHAWTFAGSGAVTCSLTRPLTLEIRDNPIAQHGCVWHIAVFEQLFATIIAPQVRVRHPTCCEPGADACRFEFDLGAH